MPGVNKYVGEVLEFRLDENGRPYAEIACPSKGVPAPGQYLLAHPPGNFADPLGTALFLRGTSPRGFFAAPPLPESWTLGTPLHFRGPLGKGFRLPPGLRTLALVAFDSTVDRLLPLIPLARRAQADVALFTGAPLPALPAAVEVQPLSALPEALSWAGFLALDLRLEQFPTLQQALGLDLGQKLPCPTQALVCTPMPCAGLAACGVCAVHTRRGYALACKDGPVFDARAVLS